MCWYTKPYDFKCNECNEGFEFIFDTLYIASHGGLKCPKCKSDNVEKVLKEIEFNALRYENKESNLGTKFTQFYFGDIPKFQLGSHIENNEDLKDALAQHGFKILYK